MLIVFAATKGFLDKLDLESIGPFERLLLGNVAPGLLNTIKVEKAISEATSEALTTYIKAMLLERTNLL